MIKPLYRSALKKFRSYQKPINFAFNALSQVVEFYEKPGGASAAKLAFGLAKAVLDYIPEESGYFSADKWAAAPSGTLRFLYEEALTSGKYPIRHANRGAAKSAVGDDSETKYGPIYVSVDGTEIGVDTILGYPCIYLPKSSLEKAKGSLYSAMERHYRHPVLLESAYHPSCGWVVNATPDETPTHPTQEVVAVSLRLKKYLAKGINRSVMFHGPPGTGKTTLAQSICAFLSLRTVRFTMSDLGRISLVEIVEQMKPQAILIDDIDRIEDHAASLLPLLERLHQKVPFVFLSVNSRGLLDPAAIRPDRIDEMILVKSVGREVVDKIVAAPFEHLRDRVSQWPVAFIAEMMKRLSVEPESEDAVVRDLEERVRFNDVKRSGLHGGIDSAPNGADRPAAVGRVLCDEKDDPDPPHPVS